MSSVGEMSLRELVRRLERDVNAFPEYREEMLRF